MSDSLPTVWPISDHTLAKHRILKSYLEAWMVILSRQASKLEGFGRQICFIDAFAGPGSYAGGESGSPLLALEAALRYSSLPVPIRFIFIEKDEARFNRLQYAIDDFKSKTDGKAHIQIDSPYNGDADEVVNDIIDQFEKASRKFGPALVFLDQFGYGSVPMSLIERIMSFPQCEVFSYLDARAWKRFNTDKNKWPTFERAFGNKTFQEAKNGDTYKFLEAYKQRLREVSNSQYVFYFSMYNEHDVLLYWLFFCTKNIRGLEEMKKAMLKVDTTGLFRFSDKTDPDQMVLMTQANDEWLKKHLKTAFSGETATVGQIYEYVLTETPCVNYKGVLQKLESEGSLTVKNPPLDRRKGSFSDYQDMILKFGAVQLGFSF